MNRKQKVVSIVVAGAILAGGGIAYSQWTATVDGYGEAKATSAQSLTVEAASGTADLYPGFAGGDVHFEITNPNPYPVTYTQMTVNSVTTNNTDCPPGSIVVTSPASFSLRVATSADPVPESIDDVVEMLFGAPDECQGATYTISLTLTGSQSS
jgi:hypothetical protein